MGGGGYFVYGVEECGQGFWLVEHDYSLQRFEDRSGNLQLSATIPDCSTSTIFILCSLTRVQVITHRARQHKLKIMLETWRDLY